MKKIIAITLVLLTVCLSLFSCATSDAPEGMKSATVETDPFILYVPENWTTNTESGISSAYYYFGEDQKIIVTARYFAPRNESRTIDDYITSCADSYAEAVKDFKKTAEVAGATLGGADARKLTYTMSADGTKYDAIQISAKHEGVFVSLNFYATGAGIVTFEESMTEIISNFKFREMPADTGDEFVDKNTPEGMKIASSDNVEYRFYVPKTWICSSTSGISEAYYPDIERINVTVTSYSPNSTEVDMTLDDYLKKQLGGYADTFGFSFGPVGPFDDVKVANLDAKRVSFYVEYGALCFNVSQVVFYSPSNGLFYTITYTATPYNYQQHIADFDKMLAEFTFR